VTAQVTLTNVALLRPLPPVVRARCQRLAIEAFMIALAADAPPAIVECRERVAVCWRVRSSCCPKTNIHIHGDPTGAAGTFMIRPTTAPSASTSKSSSFHSPDRREAEARLIMRVMSSVFPRLFQGSISRAAPKYRRYIGAGRKRRCVKREAHRPHTEALGSSAQMRCVSC
jgi:hypothetical protein